MNQPQRPQVQRRPAGTWQCPTCNAYGMVFAMEQDGTVTCLNCNEQLDPPDPIVTGL